MIHIRNSKPDSIFLLEHEGIPNGLLTNFNETIINGSLCVDTVNNQIYQLRTNIWIKIGSSLPIILNNDPTNYNYIPDYIGQLAINSITSEVYVANGTNSWVAITDGTNKTSNVVNPTPIIKSHAELKHLKDANALVPNQKYKMYFLTVHKIPHTGVLNIDSPFFVPIPENLILTANSTNSFYEEVKSELYTSDKILFDFDNIVCEDGTSSRIGLITYREDKSRNVSTHYDWRNVLYRRWSIDKQKYYAYSGSFPTKENQIGYYSNNEESGVWQLLFDYNLYSLISRRAVSGMILNESFVPASGLNYNVNKTVWKPVVNIRGINVYAESTSGQYMNRIGFSDTPTFLTLNLAGGVDSIATFKSSITSFNRKTFQFTYSNSGAYNQAKGFYQNTFLNDSAFRNINIGKTIQNNGFNNITYAAYSMTQVKSINISDECYDMSIFNSPNLTLGKNSHDLNIYFSASVTGENGVSNTNVFRSPNTILKKDSNNNISMYSVSGNIIMDGKYNCLAHSNNFELEYNTANNVVLYSFFSKVYSYCTDNKFMRLTSSTIQDNCKNNTLVSQSYQQYNKITMESGVTNCYWNASMDNVKMGANSDNVDIGNNITYGAPTSLVNVEFPQRTVSSKSIMDRYQGTAFGVDYLYDFVGLFKDVIIGNALEFTSSTVENGSGLGLASSKGYVSPFGYSYPTQFYEKLNIPSTDLVENTIKFTEASTTGYLLYDKKVFIQEIYLMDYISDVTLFYKEEGSSTFTQLGNAFYTNGDLTKLTNFNNLIRTGTFSDGKWVLKIVAGSSNFPISGDTESGVFIKYYKYKN